MYNAYVGHLFAKVKTLGLNFWWKYDNAQIYQAQLMQGLQVLPEIVGEEGEDERGGGCKGGRGTWWPCNSISHCSLPVDKISHN